MPLLRSRLLPQLQALLDLLLPPACPLCGANLPQGPDQPPLCPACLAGIRPLESPCCPRCALPYPAEEGTDHLCEPCLRRPPPFAWVAALGLYMGTLQSAVQRLKFSGAIGLDRPLASLLADRFTDQVREFEPDLLLPVPLHRDRLRRRSYNQSLLIARVLGRRWGVPVACRSLVRTRDTPPQQALKADIRQRNLQGAFRLLGPLAGERVILVDDVMTTGATARECSRVLLTGGASAVAVTVLARTPRP
ncbi:amidophosphoribosyltransferase [Desulfuromonas versatilis]|uniref:Amidophosphoribosyltransferase n=1 Tax=Desulfuromonas versatilis TaxID=2802975 RepID=A0ABM8HT14_9BACT|nr:ComF family protein [Desulfuromonas versatilis]BCR03592.1 amidophosphoribosyltransferase [Desulfuromonas versatilis]